MWLQQKGVLVSYVFMFFLKIWWNHETQPLSSLFFHAILS